MANCPKCATDDQGRDLGVSIKTSTGTTVTYRHDRHQGNEWHPHEYLEAMARELADCKVDVGPAEIHSVLAGLELLHRVETELLEEARRLRRVYGLTPTGPV